MKPHEETWSVKGCGNPNHGPEWKCHKVVDANGKVILAGLSLASAERHASLPEMARALLANGYKRASDGLWHSDCCNEQNDGGVSCFESCEKARAALTKAGVLP